MTLDFFVNGLPKGQPRPRATIRGRHAGVYDPKTADAWKQAVELAYRAQAAEPFTGPVHVVLLVSMPMPQRGRKSGDPHTARPDADNLAKAILDALTTAGAWRDDSQVYSLAVQKIYGEIPGSRIRIAGQHEPRA